MKTMKFGGGCLKDIYGLRRVVELIRAEEDVPCVVVSALSGVTDSLIQGLDNAVISPRNIHDCVANCRKTHLDILDRCVSDGNSRENAFTAVNMALEKVERILTGVSLTGETTVALRNLILSFGERLSAEIVAAALRAAGGKAVRLDADAIGILTDDNLENATANLPACRSNVQENITTLRHDGVVPVITGFFGVTLTGRTAVFGRNGSDYSAAVVAYAVEADELEIWKDVDGFMTADPRLIPRAKKIDRLSYYEAAELSYFGADILHPRTLEPVSEMNIAVRIKSMADPSGSGTEISLHGYECKEMVKSVTMDDHIAMLRIHGSGVGYKPGIIGRIGGRLAERGVNIHAIITAQTCINLLLDRRNAHESREALSDLETGVIEKLDLEEDIALIAAVGDGIMNRKGVAARIFAAVSKAGVNVEMISSGASEAAAYFIVKRRDGERTVAALHREFFEDND